MLSLGGAVNSGADWVCGMPLVRSIVSNSVFTALLITALAAIVALSVYRAQLKGAGGRKAVRAFLYLFFLVTAVMFVHQYTLTKSARASAESQNIRDVFAGIQQSRATGGDPRWEPAARGGDIDPDCGCPAMASNTTARPNNVMSSLDIQDVALPATLSPF
jgi:hypothetical protein